MVVNVFLVLNTNFSTILYLLSIAKGINPYHQWHVTHLIILALTPSRPGKGPQPTGSFTILFGPFIKLSQNEYNFDPILIRSGPHYS
jgi:hypothetical protein